MNKIEKVALIGAGIAVGAGAAWVAGTWGFAWFSTHPVRLPVWRSRHETWPLEEISFSSRDGSVCLSGWFVPSENARGTVILCHGHPANRMEMRPWAQLLHSAGFHVLLFDFRAMGRSGGRLSSIGHREVEDLLGAVDFLRGRPEARPLPIGVFGISMGGAVSLMAAAREPAIAAIATQGAYADLERAIAQRGRFVCGPLGPAFAAHVTRIGRRWIDAPPADVSPLRIMAAIAPRPVLLFHGAHDPVVHTDDARALHQAAGEPKNLRVLARSHHMHIAPDLRADVEQELIAFFQTHLFPTGKGTPLPVPSLVNGRE